MIPFEGLVWDCDFEIVISREFREIDRRMTPQNSGAIIQGLNVMLNICMPRATMTHREG
jgi:hypothetical protein